MNYNEKSNNEVYPDTIERNVIVGSLLGDGSLVIDHYSRSHKIQIFPRVALYTLCFSYEENLLLIDHIKNTFDIEFKLKKRPDGKNYILEINRRNEIYKFIVFLK